MTEPPMPEPSTKLAVFAPDLMDSSKIAAAYPDAEKVRSVAKLAAVEADYLIVDLSRPGALDAIASLTVDNVVGFAPHVDDATIAAAAAAGCRAMPRSRFFRTLGRLFAEGQAETD